MHDFVFQNTTKIRFGANQLQYLGEEIKRHGSRLLMVYGGGSIKKTGLYDKIVSALRDADIAFFELSGVEPNPRHVTVNRGAAICKKEKIDVLLAVGGGSTIDCAKAIAAAALHEGDSWDLVIRKAPITRALPILTVLTIAATGSEMNCAAVISNMDSKDKYALIHPLLQPKTSFLDPTITYSVNAFQTACGGADILSHVFDCFYFTTAEKMDMIDRISEEILKTVIHYTPRAIQKPDDYPARANLMWASSWALNGFIGTGAAQKASCHAMEHELSAFYDITHGLGLAILTPRWMEYILDENTAPQFKKLGENVFGLDAAPTDMAGAQKAITALSDFLFKTLGLPSRLSAIGIDDKHFALMAKKACGGGVLKGYKPLDAEDIEAIYRLCL